MNNKKIRNTICSIFSAKSFIEYKFKPIKNHGRLQFIGWDNEKQESLGTVSITAIHHEERTKPKK